MNSNRIAIIGGGIAGLTAAYLLHDKYDVTLFERSDRVGGNAYTMTTSGGDESDIATAAFGSSSYKNVLKLFRQLDVSTVRSFRLRPCEFSGPGAAFIDLDTNQGLFLTPGLKGLLAQQFALMRPHNLNSLLRLLTGVKRGQALSRQGGLDGLTLEAALKKIPALRGDAKLMFICCLCLMSSMHSDAVLDAPASFFFNKLAKYHDLLPPRALYAVRFTRNGTKSYVRALAAHFPDAIILKADIRAVRRQDARVLVHMADGTELPFSKVVFACNADQALALLEQPTADEQRLLGAWKYTEGNIVVHTDHARFPRRDLAEGYTFLYRAKGRYIETSVSGSLRTLPGVSRTSDLISTQHANFPIAQDSRVFEKVFRTPLFDFTSCATQPELPALNGVRNTFYCGSHFGFGLHEDAVTSAIEVARMLGVEF